MARKSSMRKRGLDSLFRATQPARDEQEQKQGMDRDADQDSRETEDARSGEVGSGVDPPAGEGESRAGAGRRRLIPPVSYTHLRAHETDSYLVCRLLLEKKKRKDGQTDARH